MKSVPEIAFEWQYHKMTKDDMARDLRDRIYKTPAVSFGKLRAGKTYLVKSKEVMRVEKVMPSGKQAQVTIFRRDQPDYNTKIFAGSYYGDVFTEIDKFIFSLGDITHEMIVTDALKFWGVRAIPARVRRDHPQLFIKIPERLGTKDAAYDSGWKTHPVDRVKEALHHYGKYPDFQVMEEIISGHHQHIRDLSRRRVAAQVLNPNTAKDWDEYIKDHEEAVDFYRWLQPHVAPGGVFFIDEEK